MLPLLSCSVTCIPLDFQPRPILARVRRLICARGGWEAFGHGADHRCTKDAAEERAGLKPGPYKGNFGWVQPFDTKRVASDPPRRADEWPFEAQGKRVTRKRKAVASENEG